MWLLSTYVLLSTCILGDYLGTTKSAYLALTESQLFMHFTKYFIKKAYILTKYFSKIAFCKLLPINFIKICKLHHLINIHFSTNVYQKVELATKIQFIIEINEK